MSLPEIDSRNINKPLCYDPKRKKFIMYNEIVSGTETIVPVDDLSTTETKTLIIERIKNGPDFKMQTMSGPPMNKKDIIEGIKNDNEIGRMTMEAEISMLRDLLKQIKENLPNK